MGTKLEPGKRIIWGAGGFKYSDWDFVYNLIIKYRIRTVLEYGCGLSTELLKIIGMDVLSLETQEAWAKPYLDDKRFKIIMCNYSIGYPDLKTKFDLAFIDAPGEKEIHDRSKSVIHAKKYCSHIYLHDYNLNQYEHLDCDTDWILCTKARHKNSFYIHKDVLI
jgi:hypothetical protein